MEVPDYLISDPPCLLLVADGGRMADPLSRGDGKALKAAGEALREAQWNDVEEPDELALVAYDAILDALLSELPEEAVEAAKRAALAEVHGSPHEQSMEYSGHIEGTKAAAETAISTFLLSLRSSSRGPADGG